MGTGPEQVHHGDMQERPPGDAGAGEDAAPAPERELRRSPPDGVVTGVCAGLGAYTRVDPVVWRAGFVVTALAGGAGVLLYLGAWGLMRDQQGGPGLLEQLLNRHFDGDTILQLLAVGLGVSTLFGLFTGVWGAIALGVPLTLGLLAARARGVQLGSAFRGLSRRVRESGPPPPAPSPAQASAYYNPAEAWSADAAGPVDVRLVARGGAEPPAEPRREPADGSGAPPESGAEGGRTRRTRARTRRPRRRPLLLALALWFGLGAVGVAIAANGGPSAAAFVGEGPGTVFLGSLIVIVGCALLAGAWFGDARGLVTTGTLLVLLAAATVAVDLTGLRFGPVDWRPTNTEQASRPFELSVGEAELDLTRVELVEGEEVQVDTRVRFGTLLVRVPEEADLELRGQLGLGEITVEDRSMQGYRVALNESLPARSAPDSAGESAADPPVVRLTVDSVVADVTVNRG